MKLKKEKQANILLIILSVLMTTITYFALEPSLPKYKIFESHYENNRIDLYENFFEEIDGGEDELCTIYKESEDGSYTRFPIFDGIYSKPKYNEFYLADSNLTINKEQIFFYDLNKDSVKECFLMYRIKDTVFLSIRDIKNDLWMLNREKIIEKPSDSFTPNWLGFNYSIMGVYVNNKKEFEVYFLTTAGYSLNPRGIFKYNIKTKKISSRTFGNAVYLSNQSYRFVDLDNDGKLEILLCGQAPGNTWRLSKLPEYDDFHARLFVLDMDFKILKAHTLNSKSSEAQHCVLSIINSKSLDLYLTYLDALSSSYTVYKISNDYSLIPIELDSQLNLKDFSDLGKFYISNSLDYFYIFDKKFRVINKTKISSHIYPINLEYTDFPDNYLFVGFNQLFDNNLKSIQSFPGNEYSNSESYNGISWRFSENNTTLEILRNGEKKTHFTKIIASNIYKFRFFFFIPLFLIFILLSFYGKRKYFKTVIYFSYLNLSSNQSTNPILLISPTGNLTFHNKSAKRFFGLSKNNKKQYKEKVLEVIPNLMDFAHKSENSFRPFTIDLDVSTNNDSRKIKLTIRPVKIFGTLILAYFLRIDDYTEEIYDERTKVLAHSVQKVAHEIKTPLSSVLLNLDAINQKSDDKLIGEDLDLARKEISRIRDFINNFLKFASMQEPIFSSFNAESLVHEASLRFSSYTERNISLKFDIDPKIKIIGDEYQLKEVFQVLIENAIDAVKGKGEILIRVQKTLMGAAECAKFEFIDSGEGIPEHIKTSLFDPYVTTKLHGTGMGLSIAKKILEDHGSTLTFTSTKKQGTTFSFNLKCAQG